MGKRLLDLSIARPKLLTALTLLLTAIFAIQLPKIATDTDPKNMLPITSPVRQYNDQVERWFGLHADILVLGIQHEAGLFNPESLGKIARVTEEILKIRGVIARDVISLPTVDDVTVAGDLLQARPLLAGIPKTSGGAGGFRKRAV